MSFFRVPGPLGLLLGAKPPDKGTLARTYSPPPVPVGGASKSAEQMSGADLDFIESTVGKGMDGKVLPRPALARSHDLMLKQYEEAVRQFGARSHAAAFTKATLVRLEAYMAEAKKPRGKAAERMSRLLEQAEDAKAAVSDDAIQRALHDVLKEERAARKRHPEGAGEDAAMPLMVKAIEVMQKRKEDTLDRMLEAAKVPGNHVSESQISKALATVLGFERQAQLLGMREKEGQSRATELMIKAIDIGSQRREAALRKVIEEAKKKGSKVTDGQMAEAVRGVLGAERQKQLLGMAEDKPSEAMAMAVEAMGIAKVRHKQELTALAQQARKPGGGVSRKQMQQAIAKVLGDERQAQLLGGEDARDDEMWELIEHATKLYPARHKESSKRTPRRPAMMMEPIKVYGRVPPG